MNLITYGIYRLRKAIAGIDNPLARVILFGLGRSALWTPADYAALSKAGYENCVTLYACVNYICRAAAGIEWTATVGKKDASDHASLKLLARPNDGESRRAFIFKSFASLLISGNRYILAGRIGQQPPLALWCPRPDLMQIVPGGNKGQIVDHYEYGKTGTPAIIDPGLIMHSKLFHPTENFYGLSPLSVASHAIDISNMANEWNMRLLQNDMRPPGALSTDAALSPAQYDQLKRQMKENWQGYENAGQPLLLEGGLKWMSFMLTAKEMDWLNTTKVTKRDICVVFNIDPCLVGDNEYATYSNKVEARKGAYEDVIVPFMEEFRDDLNAWLAPMFGDGLVLDINKDKIPALQESREKQYTYLSGAWWLRVDELRKITGQDPVGGSTGELILVPVGKIPIEAVGVNDTILEDPDEDEEDDEDAGKSRKTAPVLVKGFWQSPERKRALWDNYVTRVKAKERGLELLARAYLEAQAKAVGSKARDLGSLQEIRTAVLVDVDAEASRFRKAVKPWYQDAFLRAGVAGIRASKGEMPDVELKADLFNLTAEQAKMLDDMILRSGTKIAESTMKLIKDFLKTAEMESMTVNEIAQALTDKLETFSAFRCRRIARTEAAKIENWGNLEGFKEVEFVNMKGWGSSFVPESRESHKAADGQEVGIDDDFDVGGVPMQYPGDPSRSEAGDVVNCLCFMYPLVSG